MVAFHDLRTGADDRRKRYRLTHRRAARFEIRIAAEDDEQRVIAGRERRERERDHAMRERRSTQADAGVAESDVSGRNQVGNARERLRTR